MKLFNLIDNKEKKLQYMDICLIEKVKPIVFAIKSFVYIYHTGSRLVFIVVNCIIVFLLQ